MEQDPITSPEGEANDVVVAEMQASATPDNNDQAEDPGAGAADELQIPDNWEQPLKDFLNSITDPTGRKAAFDKLKSFDDGYQKKMTELGNNRKSFEAERKAFEDDRSFLSSYRGFEKQIAPEDAALISGKFGNIPNYMQYLYNMDRMASQDPAQFIVQFCRGAGIDSVEALEQMLGSPQAQKQRAGIDTADLERKLMGTIEQRLQTERETAKLEAKAEAFANAADEAGNPKYPHFEQVRKAMGQLAAAIPDASLEELYDLAVYRDPSLRQLSMAKTAEAVKKADADAVEKAKKAVGISGAPSKGTKKQSSSEYLAQVFGGDDDE